MNKFLFIGIIILLVACTPSYQKGTFGYEMSKLNNVEDLILLQSGNSMLAISADLQGRVLVASANGYGGQVHGWYNDSLIENGHYKNKYANLGGASRLWFGPEGGNYGLCFKNGEEQTKHNVFRPAALDTAEYQLISKDSVKASFAANLYFKNYQDFEFNIAVERQIELNSKADIEKDLAIYLSDSISCISFSAMSKMTNAGQELWTKEKGLIALWELSCFIPTRNSTVIIPLKHSTQELTDYLSNLNDSRLSIVNNTAFFKVDGSYLSKIGILKEFSKSMYGCYCPEKGLLTMVHYSLSDSLSYVNSLWGEQNAPYIGDAINVFNGGVDEDGIVYGPMFELETSSGVSELAPGESLEHEHSIYLFEGEEAYLDSLSTQLLGLSLMEIKLALP